MLLNNSTGSNNTANGYQALVSNSTGSYNTVYGNGAMNTNTVGNYDTAVGNGALYNNQTGSSNVGLGYMAGGGIVGGINNTAIGGNFTFNTNSGTIYIGDPLFSYTKSIYIAGIAGTTITGAGVNISYSSNSYGRLGVLTSSSRFKKNIQRMDAASDPLLSLQPFTYKYKPDLDPAGTPQYGLVAEDVARINPDLVVRDKDGLPYTVRYQAVDAMLLNEYLKENKEVEEGQALLGADRQKLDRLKARIREAERRGTP